MGSRFRIVEIRVWHSCPDRLVAPLLALLWVTACVSSEGPKYSENVTATDGDAGTDEDPSDGDSTDSAQTDSDEAITCNESDEPIEWYPDCDGDSVFSAISTLACGEEEANQTSSCLDGEGPDGGWSTTLGTDCDDEDDSIGGTKTWYPDCDGDGVFHSAATLACGAVERDEIFDCWDGEEPNGGWSEEPGTDCDDEYLDAAKVTGWYPDCDGDGAYRSVAISACGTTGADAGSDCGDSQNPDGGWSSSPGVDCNDEDRNNPCACGQQDNDGDGSCAPVSTLEDAAGVTTGTTDFELASGTLSLHIDGDYDGGGWILIGRGREGWEWTDDGIGLRENLPMGMGTPAGFTPEYLSSDTINDLIDNSGIELTEVDMRVKRAANAAGTAYQETLWRAKDQTTWTWLLPSASYNITYTVLDSVLGTGTTFETNTRELRQSFNDHRRTFTWGWASHNSMEGFSYGNAVSGGTNDPNNFFWQHGTENHAIPYSEVYIRIR